MDKKLTIDQITEQAKKLGVETNTMRAMQQIEARGSGFLPTGEPLILFEHHIFYKKLREMNYANLANKFMQLRPDLCQPNSGGYGKTSEQHGRLQDSINLVFKALPNLDPNKPSDKIIIDDVRDCGLMACSWGIGQVMGANWHDFDYPSLQDFINDMYDSEGKQLEAMCRFIRHNGLIDELQRHDWKTFARIYNGPAYQKNQYDAKLASAYQQLV